MREIAQADWMIILGVAVGLIVTFIVMFIVGGEKKEEKDKGYYIPKPIK